MALRKRKTQQVSDLEAEEVLSDPEGYGFLVLTNRYRQKGKYEEALQVCQAGVEHHPDFLSARAAMGLILAELGRTEEAQSELQAVLEASPTNLLSRRTLARLYREAGDTARARREYKALQWHLPEDAEVREALEELGPEDAGAGEVDESGGVEDLAPMAEGDNLEAEAPEVPEAWEEGAPDEETFPELAGMDASDPLYTRTLAKLYEEQGHWEEALKTYRMILKEAPDDREIQSKIRELERAQGPGQVPEQLEAEEDPGAVALETEAEFPGGGERPAGSEPPLEGDLHLLDISDDDVVDAPPPEEPGPVPEAFELEEKLEGALVEEPEDLLENDALPRKPEAFPAEGTTPGPEISEAPERAADVAAMVGSEAKPGAGGGEEDYLSHVDDIVSDAGELPPDSGPSAGSPAAVPPAPENEETVQRLEGLLERVRKKSQKDTPS